MKTVRAVSELRTALGEARRAGHRIGFVPTMGALHAGHLSLIEAAAKECDLVVLSIFVNPSQFDDQADLLRYPRQEARDAELAQAAGADILFAPQASEMYRPGFNTAVEVLGLTERLEGEVRGSGHFRGVTTVVCKLLNITMADVACFGQKDAQQAAVVRRMVEDLDIPTKILTLPTVREQDGLAMSSRNARLTASERRQALGLHAALQAAERRLAAGERSSAALLEAASAAIAPFELQLEYAEIVDERTFEPMERLHGDGLLLIAARVGQTRLIDNVLLRCPAAQRPDGIPEGVPHHDHDQGELIPACSA